jgi:hypothetical protein
VLRLLDGKGNVQSQGHAAASLPEKTDNSASLAFVVSLLSPSSTSQGARFLGLLHELYEHGGIYVFDPTGLVVTMDDLRACYPEEKTQVVPHHCGALTGRLHGLPLPELLVWPDTAYVPAHLGRGVLAPWTYNFNAIWTLSFMASTGRHNPFWILVVRSYIKLVLGALTSMGPGGGRAACTNLACLSLSNAALLARLFQQDIDLLPFNLVTFRNPFAVEDEFSSSPECECDSHESLGLRMGDLSNSSTVVATYTTALQIVERMLTVGSMESCMEYIDSWAVTL